MHPVCESISGRSKECCLKHLDSINSRLDRLGQYSAGNPDLSEIFRGEKASKNHTYLLVRVNPNPNTRGQLGLGSTSRWMDGLILWHSPLS